MKIFGEHNKAITYEYNKTKKEASGITQKDTKDDIKKMLSEAPAYDAIIESKPAYDSRFNDYFMQIEKSMSDGVTGAIGKYGELYNDIMSNSDEKERDSLVGLLDSAFEYAGTFYASAMASRITFLSGVKLKAEIPALGSHTMKKTDNSAFDSLLEKRKQITDEIKNTFSNLKDHFQRNRNFADISSNASYGNTNALSISDLDQLSKGFAKELQDMQKKGSSSGELLEKVSQSSLSDYAKQLLNSVIEFGK